MIGKKLTNKKALVLVCLLGMLLGVTGCSGRKTVLLESEDLVRAEGQTEDEDSFEALEETLEQVEQSTLFVHICGEVENPGVYELPKGSRIYEAVEKAGGFTKEAAADYVNLAHLLEDGWKIEIPAAESFAQDEHTGDEGLTEGKSSRQMGSMDKMPDGLKDKGAGGIFAGAAADADTVMAAAPAPAFKDKLAAAGTDNQLGDLNTATEEELVALPGIGESRAKSIIAYREKNGGFSKIEDIMKIEGIKEGMFAKMKDKICVRGEK